MTRRRSRFRFVVLGSAADDFPGTIEVRWEQGVPEEVLLLAPLGLLVAAALVGLVLLGVMFRYVSCFLLLGSRRSGFIWLGNKEILSIISILVRVLRFDMSCRNPPLCATSLRHGNVIIAPARITR